MPDIQFSIGHPENILVRVNLNIVAVLLSKNINLFILKQTETISVYLRISSCVYNKHNMHETDNICYINSIPYYYFNDSPIQGCT
jgi:hypothetical protein